MIPDIYQIRNRLLSGWERHPWDHHYQVRRKDVLPGLRILVKISTPTAQTGHVTISKVETTWLIFTSQPFCKNDHWYATAKDEDTGSEADYSLFALGIVPDYLFVPKKDGIYPAGWNAYAKNYFNR